MKPGSQRSPGGLAAPGNRARLVEDLRRGGVHDERVLAAIAAVPRHEFVEPAWRAEAYQHKALPIGLSQTISQPYIVALMTQTLLEGGPRKRVLEIGTGSGYQTAVLSPLVDIVYSVERIKALSESARARLRGLGLRNVHFAYADGMLGWEAHAPYDGIIVTAAAAEVPDCLRAQLAVGGRLVIPVGASQSTQALRVIDRSTRGFSERDLLPVSFVPLLGGKA